MSIAELLLEEAGYHGVDLYVRGDNIRVRCKGGLPAGFKVRLKEHKLEVRTELNRQRDATLSYWRDGVRKMRAEGPPDGWPPSQWRGLCSVSESFIDNYGELAHWFGWTTLDIFGVHHCAPLDRMECIGLVLRLSGEDHVVRLGDVTATIRHANGYTTTFCRNPRHHEFVPVWKLCVPKDDDRDHTLEHNYRYEDLPKEDGSDDLPPGW